METRHMSQILIAVLAVSLLFLSATSSAYAYSSSLQAEAEISAVCNTVEGYDADGNEVYGSIITKNAFYSQSGGTYSFLGGNVSEGLHLTISGKGNYALGAIIENASVFLSSVEFTFGDEHLSISLSGGNGSAYLDNRVYAAGSEIGFTAYLGEATSDNAALTIGDVKFVTVSIGDQETVPSDLVLDGSYVCIGENVVPTTLREIITNSEDVQKAIKDANNGSDKISGSAGGKEKSYYIRQTDDVGGYPAVLISTSSKTDNITTPGFFKATDFNVDVPVPGNVMCLVAVTVTGTVLTENYMDVTINGHKVTVTGNTWSKTTYYLYLTGDTLNMVPDIPPVKNWMNTGEKGLSINVDGTKNLSSDMVLEFRVLMQSVPL